MDKGSCVIAMDNPPKNIWEPDLWMCILFLARKREVVSGVMAQLSLTSILMVVIANLKYSSAEEVVKATK